MAESLCFRILLDRYGRWDLPFAGSMLLMALGVVPALRMKPENRFESAASAPDGVAANGASAHAPTAAIIK